MRRTKGVSTFMATLLLVTISLSLSYVVYEAVSRIPAPQQEVFTNQVSEVGGPDGIVQIVVNASSPASPLAFEAGSASSSAGILAFNGTAYGTTRGLCAPGETTFFSIKTSTGLLRAAANGPTWIDGHWTDSLAVGAGWQEVMFSNASSCTLTVPSGALVTYPSSEVSGVPLLGALPSTGFELYVPAGTLEGPFLMVFDGSYDNIA